MGRHLQHWRGEPGSPGLVSRALMIGLALFPPLAAANWLAVLVLGDQGALVGATLLLIAGLLVAASYPYWLGSIWAPNNRYRIAEIRARRHVPPTHEHLALHAKPGDLPRRW